MENTEIWKAKGMAMPRWTPTLAKAQQDTRARPNSLETNLHVVRKRWDIGLLREQSPWLYGMGGMSVCPSGCAGRGIDNLALLYSNRNRKLQTSKAPLKSQAQGTSLFTSAASNQRGFPIVRGRLKS